MNVELESLGLTYSCYLLTVYVMLGSLFYTSLCSVVSNPRDHTPPGSSVHGFSQARIQKWVAFPSLGYLPNPETEAQSLASPALAD